MPGRLSQLVAWTGSSCNRLELAAGGSNTIEAQMPLHEPELWWPNGQGDQPLYDLQVHLQEIRSGNELDFKAIRFGVREVLWKPTEGAPLNFINPYGLVVNGRPIRMMESNVIPPDLFFGRNGERAPRLVQLAQAAGMNTLRIWGGGVTLPTEFYDRADELGIMLSHGFRWRTPGRKPGLSFSPI